MFRRSESSRNRGVGTNMAVCLLGDDDLGAEETEAAERVLATLLRAEDNGMQWIIIGERPCNVQDLLRLQKCEAILFLHSMVFITYEGACTLARILRGTRTLDVVAPVGNESQMPLQQFAPPFLYQTVSVFQWAAEEVFSKFHDTVQEAEAVDRCCFALRTETLRSFPGEADVRVLPDLIREKKMRCGIAKGVYVHRYGNIYESGREDLLSHVPDAATEILDIGCARGLFGELLKKRQKCRVTGIDMDSRLLAYAKERIDEVIHGDIEEVVGRELLKTYDCIVCGDILEHLRNPWSVAQMLMPHLNAGGRLIASTPNINNWAILHELLNGEWNYVPFSILSGGHVRFFTRKTLTGLFQGAGYQVKETHLHGIGVPPRGEEFIEGIMNLLPGTDKEELMASEITLIAERPSS